ncbi:hypothetical protein Lsai_2452 [Legionella sainthelensi]|uniref:Uncharacterized protein n=1 Tax=Legionella sainthelensi TaxID=28087 RepID=A0A0W0YD68_9GAMM|nr:hypothetical protein Lsai_2452 [Legionella sainthelensi]VEH37401.1 Uncharacterised protein [Legionella sainthelensi]
MTHAKLSGRSILSNLMNVNILGLLVSFKTTSPFTKVLSCSSDNQLYLSSYTVS